LVICTRDEALSLRGHSSIAVFQHRRPELRLKNGDQRFLEIALEGLTDDELARKLGVSSSSVKKRWLSLFESVAAIHPEIFPNAEDSPNRTVRGRQKRHLLLAYIRTHPEELQPYEWGQ
jgi:DNA-binding CsgD family transcriptional regulator